MLKSVKAMDNFGCQYLSHQSPVFMSLKKKDTGKKSTYPTVANLEASTPIVNSSPLIKWMWKMYVEPNNIFNISVGRNKVWCNCRSLIKILLIALSYRAADYSDCPSPPMRLPV